MKQISKDDCWCKDLNYVCTECEKPIPPKNMVLLKHYLKLSTQEIFNPEIKEHFDILMELEKTGDSVLNLTREESREVEKEALEELGEFDKEVLKEKQLNF